MSHLFAFLTIVIMFARPLSLLMAQAQPSTSQISHVRHVREWKIPFGKNNMGSSIDYVGYESRVVIHNEKIYFVDIVYERVNFLDIKSGRVVWGKKGSLDPVHMAEDIAWFRGHLLLLSQFGLMAIDSNLSVDRFEQFKNGHAGPVWDSHTDTSIVALIQQSEFNDAGTGQRFYATYLYVDKHLSSWKTIIFLGRTSHLDAPNPPDADSTYWRADRDWQTKHCGKPLVIRYIGADTCLDSGSHLLAIPPPFGIVIAKHPQMMDFDSDRIAIWDIDESAKAYKIVLLDYLTK